MRPPVTSVVEHDERERVVDELLRDGVLAGPARRQLARRSVGAGDVERVGEVRAPEPHRAPRAAHEHAHEVEQHGGPEHEPRDPMDR